MTDTKFLGNTLVKLNAGNFQEKCACLNQGK